MFSRTFSSNTKENKDSDVTTTSNKENKNTSITTNNKSNKLSVGEEGGEVGGGLLVILWVFRFAPPTVR